MSRIKNHHVFGLILFICLLSTTGCARFPFPVPYASPSPSSPLTSTPTPTHTLNPTPIFYPTPTPTPIPTPTSILAMEQSFAFNYCELGTNGELYFDDANDYSLKKWDLTSGHVNVVKSFDSPISNMTLGGASLYIGEGARLWKCDTSTGSIQQKYNAASYINSIYYLGAYLICNDSSGAWSTNRLIRISDFQQTASKDWLDPSKTYVYMQNQNRVYILRDGTSPDDLCYQAVDLTTESLDAYGDSPYHGDFDFAHPLKQFADELKVISASGVIFDVSGTITYYGNLGYSYNDLVFDNNNIYILHTVQSYSYPYTATVKLMILDKSAPYSLISTPLTFNNRQGKRLIKNGTDLIIVTQDTNTGNRVRVDQYSFTELNAM